MQIRKTCLPLFLLTVSILTHSAKAALAVPNGTFGTTNQNARVVDGGGWFESDTTNNWVEGSWANAGSYPATFPTGSGMALLFDNSYTTGGGNYPLGYIYQSLGNITQADLDAGLLTVNADFAQKSDGTTTDAKFDLLVGNSFTGANGIDILGGGLTSIGTFTLNAAAQGLTQGLGDNSRATAVTVGTVSLAGRNVGDTVWLRIGESRLATTTGGDLIIDNVNVNVVPEPSVALLGGFGLLGLLRRRRRAC